MRQIETSHTMVLDAPRHTRAFSEALVTDYMGIGQGALVRTSRQRNHQTYKSTIYKINNFA